jgi:hypothetical protein
MKKLFLLFLIMFSLNSYSQTTSSLGGSWSNSSSWTNGVPSCGTHSEIIIQRGTTIEIKNTVIDLSSCEIDIIIEGELSFDRRGNNNVSELLLGELSTITIDSGGIIAFSNKTDRYNLIKIFINGTEVWDGSDGDILNDGIINEASVDGSQNPLPVNLKYFKGYIIKNFIYFEWFTLSEVNNDYFELYKEDISLLRINGNGTTNISHRYMVKIEYEPGYYRLKQVDLDGNFIFYNYIYIGENNIEKNKFKYYNLQGVRIYDIEKCSPCIKILDE